MEGSSGVKKLELKSGPEKEQIKAPALRYQGQVFAGVSHIEAIAKLKKVFPNVHLSYVEDGFVTTSGRFVDREEANNIAKENDQLRPDLDYFSPDTLDSTYLK